MRQIEEKQLENLEEEKFEKEFKVSNFRSEQAYIIDKKKIDP